MMAATHRLRGVMIALDWKNHPAAIGLRYLKNAKKRIVQSLPECFSPRKNWNKSGTVHMEGIHMQAFEVAVSIDLTGLGKRIKERREELGYSQEQLAEIIDRQDPAILTGNRTDKR